MTIEQLLGANDKNVAVGFWTDAQQNTHGFTYDIKSHSFTEVNIAGFASTETTAISPVSYPSAMTTVAPAENTAQKNVTGIVRVGGRASRPRSSTPTATRTRTPLTCSSRT